MKIFGKKHNHFSEYKLVKKSKLFDKKWYLQTYPDVRNAGVDPVWHYLTHGWREDRNPSDKFDTDVYLYLNPDVKQAGVCPLTHYLQHGIKENRKTALRFDNKYSYINLQNKMRHIEKCIENPNISYVSFDIFDTLLVRPAIEPRDIFYLIAQRVDKKYKLDFMSMRYDVESEMNDKYASIYDIYEFIQKKYQLKSSVTRAIMKCEIECETQLLFPRLDGKKLYDLAVKNKKHIIAVSDMYLPSDILRHILDKNGYDKIEQVFVSNEFQGRKSDSRLFRAVTGNLKISPKSILHIGDNYQSDYLIPKSLDWNVCHLPAVMDVVLGHSVYSNIFNKNISSDYGARILMGFAFNLTFGDSDVNNIDDTRIFPNLSVFSDVYLGPILFYICSYILTDKNIQEKYKRVLFASRDGWLPSRVYNLLRPIFGGVPSEYVCTGRRAYYMAHIKNFWEYLQTLNFSNKCIYTLQNVIDCYILDEKLHNKIINNISNDILGLDFTQHRDKCITELKRFDREILKHIEQLKNNAITYYKSYASKGRNIIFDCGYGGSVSDALTQITKQPFDKIYLWQNDNNVKKDKQNGTKTFALFGDRFAYLNEHIILEELFSPLSGTCIGFDKDGTPIIEQLNFSDEMRQDMETVSDTCTQFFTKIVDVFGDWLPLLNVADFNFLRATSVAAFSPMQSAEKSLFRNIVFPDSVFYSNALSLEQKLLPFLTNNTICDKPKILLVSNEMTYSGAPHSLLRMCRVLREKYDLTVWTLKSGPFEREFNNLGIPVKCISVNGLSEQSIIDKIKTFDLAICNTIITGNVCEELEKYVRCIWYIREAHNIPKFLDNKTERFLRTCKNTDIYCVSEYAKQFIDKTFNTNVGVCHNCVEDNNDGYKKKFYKNKKLNVLVMGGCEPRKNFGIVIEAIEKLPEKYKHKIHLNIAGRIYSGPYSTSILDSVNKNDNISYLGEIDNLTDKINLYKETDIVIVPSTDESCSLVTLEGIMMGCPVIVSKNVGAKYVVDDNVGWIFDTNNSDDLCEILQNVLSIGADLPEMGRAARKKYLETSNMDIYRQNILNIVQKSIAASAVPKLLVHLHLYYEAQLDYMLSKLSNISGCDWDLYVTVPHTTNHKILSKIQRFKPDVKFIYVDNIGYDVWPFIRVLQTVNLDKYDYVLKIHTKAFQERPNALGKTGFWWRNELIDVLLGSSEQFIRNINLLKLHDDIGMIGSKLMLRTVSRNVPEETTLFNKEFKRLKFSTDGREFIAGTMFMARASVFSFIKSAGLTADMFDGIPQTYGSGTLAHVYERLLGVAVSNAGYKIYPQIQHAENKVIPVAYATDNAYMPYTIVSIRSLLANKLPDTKYDIIVLYASDIDKKYLRSISKMAKNNNSMVHFYNMRDKFKNAKSSIAHISVVTYYRLALPNLLPQYDKLIWLDGDTIVCRDLSCLFNTDMGNNYIAGVLAPYVAQDANYAKILGIPNMKTYVNAGVLLWNLDLMRQNSLEQKFMSLVDINYIMADQDILNTACFGHIMLLPLRFNMMNKLLKQNNKQMVLGANLYSLQEFDNAVSAPVVIHYCDAQKPWNTPDSPMFAQWDKYSNKKTSVNKPRKTHNKNNLLRFAFNVTRDKGVNTYKVLGMRFVIHKQSAIIQNLISSYEKTFISKYQDLANRMIKITNEISEIKSELTSMTKKMEKGHLKNKNK